jgi:hypothetical protein
MNAREVIAQALAHLDGEDKPTSWDRRQADAILAALREYWTSEGIPKLLQDVMLDLPIDRAVIDRLLRQNVIPKQSWEN